MRLISQVLVILLLLLLLAPGCGLKKERITPPVLSEVDDEPKWQAEEVETLSLAVAQIVEHPIPNFDEWHEPFSTLFPGFISRENEELVVYGSHVTKNRLMPGLGNFGDIDGLNRWELDGDSVEFFPYPDLGGEPSWIYGANIPDNPGPEFCRIHELWSGGARGEGSLVGKVFHCFDSSGRLLESFNVPHFPGSVDLANNLPLDYPNNSLFMYKTNYHTAQAADGAIINVWDYPTIDLTLGNAGHLDPRSGDLSIPHPPHHWLAETGEWFCSSRVDVDDEEYSDLLVIRSDGSRVSIQPWTWPEFQMQGRRYSLWMPLEPFFWNGSRCFVIGPYWSNQRSDHLQEWWAIRFDPGSDSAEPLWSREEPTEGRRQEQVITIGPDDNPYWVRFFIHAATIRVIDLVSGECVIDKELNLGTLYRNEPRPQLLMRLDEDRDIPAVFIFDPNDRKLVQVDLEIDNK